MSLKVDNDKVFRQLFYYVYSGRQKCFTCDTTGYLGDNLQLGHFISRGNSSVACHFYDCKPQCIDCNIVHKGRPKIFRANLVLEIGEDEVIKLEQLAKMSLGSQHSRDISHKMGEIKQNYRKLDPKVVKDKLIEMNG